MDFDEQRNIIVCGGQQTQSVDSVSHHPSDHANNKLSESVEGGDKNEEDSSPAAEATMTALEPEQKPSSSGKFSSQQGCSEVPAFEIQSPAVET